MSAEKAESWLKKAENDLLSADNNLASTRIPFDVVCYNSQQAAEKLLKAAVVHLGFAPSRTHDLLALLAELARNLTTPVPAAIEECCIVLNPYAVEVRYPDDISNPTHEDALEARQAAQRIRTWVHSLLQP